MEGIHSWSIARVKALIQGSCIRTCSFFTIGSKGLGIFFVGSSYILVCSELTWTFCFLSCVLAISVWVCNWELIFSRSLLNSTPFLQCVFHWTRMRNVWAIKYNFTFVLGLSSNGTSKACFLFSGFLLFFLLLNILFYLKFILPFMESSYHKILLVHVPMRLEIQINCLIHGFLKIYGFSKHGITWSFSWT